MKKLFTSLLIGCSLSLAGAALAQQPDQQSTPKKKPGAEKAHAAQGAPGATPQERPGRQTGAMKGQGAANQPGATNEPGAGKGQKTRAGQESATGAQTGTGVSGQPAGSATPERGAGKGRKGKAGQESATGAQTGTNVSGQPAASATPGAEQPRKGMKGRAAKTSATPATTPAAATGAVSATPAAGASAASTVSATGQQRGQANAAGGKKAKPDPQQVQQIKAQHANFRAQPKPQHVPAVTYNQNYRIQGSDQWQGPQYDVFRSYHPERHDQGWYRSRYNRVELIGGGYYYWNNGYWYPAWGYNPSAEYYAYDGPIYVGQRA